MKKRKNVKNARIEPAVEETNHLDGYDTQLYELLSPAYKNEVVSPAYNSHINYLDLRLHDLNIDDSDTESSGEEHAARHRDVLPHKGKISWTAINLGVQPWRKLKAVLVAYGILALFFLITFVLGVHNVRPMKSRCKDRDIYVLVGKRGIGKNPWVQYPSNERLATCYAANRRLRHLLI